MPIPLLVMAGIGVGAQVAGGLIAGGAAKKRARAAAAEQARLQAELTRLENSRQAIVNPYADMKDVSYLAKDLSGTLTNAYANLGVATQAAKFEAEQIDVSLANTLDMLKETGAGAGGATALAQAALKAKQGISSNIEQQEAANEKLKAQGQDELQKLKMAEQQRIQGLQMSEAQRIQEAQAKGKAFVFGAQEEREMQKINRVAGLLGGAQAQLGQARADQASATAGMISGISNVFGSTMSAGAQAGLFGG
jgi:hypothetical protein